MRDQWKRTEVTREGKGHERSRGRRDSDRKKSRDDESRRGGKPRRSERQRRLDELAEFETDRMLKRGEIEEVPEGV